MMKTIRRVCAVASMMAMIVLLFAFFTAPLAGCGSRQNHDHPSAKVINATDFKIRLEALREPLTLVHVWATWCVPCREEFPDVMRFMEEYGSKGVSVILISADPPGQTNEVGRYLAEKGSGASSYIIDNPNDAFINTLTTNWSGSIPASFFLGPKGEVRQWWEGKADFEKYRVTADELLKQTNERR